MKVTGFTFIRNAITYDYPVVEAITSILSLCDDFVVTVGNSDDETRQMIADIAPGKIKIIDTVWDDSKRQGGAVLADETNKAFRAITQDSDWCFYIQGDEVVHEQYLDNIRAGMLQWKDDKRVDGLLFKYLHFYGSYDYVGTSSRWYPFEIRIVRNNKSIYSYRDAQGFRKNDNEKLNVKPLDAYVYHYGWVKDPRAMQRKQHAFHRLWHDDDWLDKNIAGGDEFNYEDNIDALQKFTGTHPAVMLQRVEKRNWAFDRDMSFNRMSAKERFKQFALEKLGWNMNYKNYRLL